MKNWEMSIVIFKERQLKYLNITQTNVMVKIVCEENMRSPHPLVASTRKRMSDSVSGGEYPLRKEKS